jgi:anti-anti-sigma regulatory factor
MDVNRDELQGDGAGEGVTLTVTGRATIQVAAELKGRLLAALHAASSITVDVSGITGADSSFFQLLCAAHRSALATGREVRLSPGRSEAFLLAARAAGFGQVDSSCHGGGCLR